jgi:hypothetical protein
MSVDLYNVALEGFKEQVKNAFKQQGRSVTERERGIQVDLMKSIVRLYRDANEYNHQWDYNELQWALESIKQDLDDDFFDNLIFFLEALYIIGKSSGSNKMHAAIDVRGDGLCFYQAFFYSLLWASPGDLEPVHTVHDVKMLIMTRLFGKKALENNAERLRALVQTGKTKEERAVLRRPVLLFETLLKDMGIREISGGSAAGAQQKKFVSSNGEWFKTDNAIAVGDAFDVQVLIYRQTSNGTASFEWNRNEPTVFSGKPVMLFLLVPGHFNILSREPFVHKGLVTKAGMGVEGMEIPKTIQFVHLEVLGTRKSLPYLHMCLLCKKWILSE